MNNIENQDSELLALAEQGDNYAQNSLGAQLAQEGGDGNLRLALHWYLKAIEGGYVDAMWNAATMLMSGEAGIKNRDFALHLIRVAAENRNTSACLYLANCYESGLEGFEKSPQLAGQWNKHAWDIDNQNDYTSPIDVSNYLPDLP